MLRLEETAERAGDPRRNGRTGLIGPQFSASLASWGKIYAMATSDLKGMSVIVKRGELAPTNAHQDLKALLTQEPPNRPTGCLALL